MRNTILVLGSTGKTGRKVAKRLQHLRHNVRLGSRVAALPFDWNQPATWARAVAGIDSVYLVYTPDLAVPGAYETVAAFLKVAQAAAVRKVVLLSGKGEREAERCENLVASSGLRFTVVRASWFAQNFSESFLIDPILAGQVTLPRANVKIPFVDTGDIADVVVESLLDDVHDGKTYEVTGPRALTFEEAVAEIARATDRNISFQAVSLDEYHAGLQASGLPDDYVWLIDYLFRKVLGNPHNQLVSQDVQRVLGRPATDFRQYANDAAAAGMWSSPVNA